MTKALDNLRADIDDKIFKAIANIKNDIEDIAMKTISEQHDAQLSARIEVGLGPSFKKEIGIAIARAYDTLRGDVHDAVIKAVAELSIHLDAKAKSTAAHSPSTAQATAQKAEATI